MKYFAKKILMSNIPGFILGALVFGGIGIVVAENIASSTVDYNKNSQATVEDALDDLYSKSESCITLPTPGSKLADYIQDLYVEDGYNNLYYHDQAGDHGVYTYSQYEAGDLSYRYSGATADVANYVCFGSDADTCPSDNLYRIIGIFKDTNNEYQVKLIKASAANSTLLGTNGAYYSGTNYYWTSSGNTSNVWSGSALNTTNLNTNYISYLNNINNKWISYIDTHTWKVAGNTDALIRKKSGANNVYYREITSPSANTTYSDEIGLMYVSDYMYAASPTYWGTQMGYNDNSSLDMRAAITANWLYLGTTEWTITRRSDNSSYAFYVNSSGNVYSNYVHNAGVVYNDAFAVRPVFYLKSGVTHAGGTGTSGDPYRISG